ncbi:MAG: xylulokinase [Spirochaetales bacterium]|uniref:Xylulose kinase n=1 Tax=Candidatus Thalassospirochaeta sargassi TaxID=3119039 RepID=A0AAJ1II50_9SPIO|nr:xylulokinase [Spirochaetales bacterium]
MKYILAHDLGTSGNKATLFAEDGKLVKSVTKSYDTVYKNGNWAEQNPEDWWTAVCQSSNELLDGVDTSSLACVAFSGQMMGCLCVDKDGTPLRPHILYCDQRAETETEALVNKLGADAVYEISGHRPSASYIIEKLMWVKNNEPDIYANTAKILNAKDYMNYRLTGRMVTDYNDASGSNAFDLKALDWSGTIIDAAEIEPDIFPEAVPSIEIIGTITKAASEATGIPEGVPVAAGAGDGGCATVGAGSVKPGATYCYLGSSSWISTTSTAPIPDAEKKTFTWAHPVPGYYQPCGTMQTAGSSYAWLRDQLAGGGAYEDINKIMAGSPAGANGVIFLPYMLGERSPRWNPDARGAFIGMSLETKQADIYRSVLEGVSMNLDIILKVMQAGIRIDDILLIGGGAKGALWRQILADIFGIPVKVPAYLEEATSMGAAIIGGVGAGVFSGFDAAERFVRITGITEPVAANSAVYEKIKPVFDMSYTSLESGGVFDEIVKLG